MLEKVHLFLMMDKQEQLATVLDSSGKPTGELHHMQQQVVAPIEQQC